MPKFMDVLRNAAPTIASALAMGGPAGVAAGAALSLVLGTKPGESFEPALLAATPEQMLALKQADYDFQIKMREADTADYATDANDRSSARAREIALHDNGPFFLACGVVGGYFLLVLFAIVYGLPAEGRDAIIALLSVLGGGVGAVMNYYFGSSRSASTAQQQISKMWDDTPSAAQAVSKPLVTQETTTPAPTKK